LFFVESVNLLMYLVKPMTQDVMSWL